MPADHMTATPLAAAVLTVLAGSPLEVVATSAGIDAVDLSDAIDIYHNAGYAALQQRDESGWCQVRVEFPDWDDAECVAATWLGPRLNQLQHGGAIGGWWFLRKHPCWRLRFADAQTQAVNQLLDELTASGKATRWWPSVYEPETTAFGGPTGIKIVHDLFCADSRGVVDYLRQPAPSLGRREMSLLLLGNLLHAVGLDWFERGDVFARVAQMRPLHDPDDSRIDTLTGSVRGLLAIAPDLDAALFGPGGAAPFAAPWHRAYADAGREFAAAAAAGALTRGVRAVATHIVIFHWNRLGLSAQTQGVLARAALEVFLPRS
jgi:thiopeptide-type bacteriocin biosynthesis protein